MSDKAARQKSDSQPGSGSVNQNPEQVARDAIDAQLRAAGWTIQSKSTIDLHTGDGQAVREYTTDSGPADYVLFVDCRPVGVIEAKKEVWYYDYRTNIHHTLKRKPLRFEDLAEFIACYNPENRHKRKETWHAEKNPTGRLRRFTHAELAARDKTSLDLFWLKDESLTDLDSLPEPADLAEEIIENIEAALANFRTVAARLAAK
ncbi:MAG TPA: hypothetical protein VHE61_10465 [Opitutaceae bacterium]|nr:hypothetical protein [Opitutaceae bacterium]